MTAKAAPLVGCRAVFDGSVLFTGSSSGEFFVLQTLLRDCKEVGGFLSTRAWQRQLTPGTGIV